MTEPIQLPTKEEATIVKIKAILQSESSSDWKVKMIERIIEEA